MDSRLLEWIKRRIGVLALTGHRRPMVALVLALLLAGAGLFAARNIRITTDLTELLPTTFESVQGLEKLKERFGGIGYVVVVGESKDPAALRRFADEIAPKLEDLPEIRWVEYQRPQAFLRDRALYYLSLEDLEQVYQRVSERVRWERRRRNPMYIQLEDDAPPSLDFSDIEDAYGARSSKRLAGTGGAYYLDEPAGIVVILAKPAGNSADLGYSQTLVDSVQALLAREDLGRYAPDLHVALTGTFQKKLDQTKQITGDITRATSLAFLVVFGYLLLHFRNPLSVLLILGPVLVGLVWTYGFVGVVYGHLNLITGFLGAVLGGLGTEHGIHLLGRYGALLRSGKTSEEATVEAFVHTGSSALLSALVAALTFFSIAISEFRAFREFGILAAVGTLMVLVAYILVLPASLGVVSRLGLRFRGAPDVPPARSELAGWLPRRFRTVALVSAVALIPVLFGIRAARFDYDIGALEDGTLPSFVLDRETNRILGHSQTPVVLLTENPDDERAAVKILGERKVALAEASSVDFVAALDDLVPADQEQKRTVLAKLDTLLGTVNAESLDGPTRTQFDELQRMARAVPFSRADLPEAITRQFVGVTASDSGFVLVFPSVSLADGKKVRELAREVRGVTLPSGRTLSAAGEPMILADILDMVTREAPRVLGAALLSALLALWITLGSVRSALLCIAPTVVSVLALVGLMPLFDLPFNYLNILVVPVLIGTTIDAGVHLLGRLSGAPEAFGRVYTETGRAIVGGLFTSAVGFSALFLADHPGLNSVGRLATLGFAVNLFFMLVVFPAVLLWISSRQLPGETPAPT